MGLVRDKLGSRLGPSLEDLIGQAKKFGFVRRRRGPTVRFSAKGGMIRGEL